MVCGAVSINGQVIEDLPAFIGSSDVKEARLPFMRVAQLLGMSVEPKDDGLFYITNGEDIYILRGSSEVSLVKQGEDSYFMIPPPGSSSYYCQYEMDDVFLDSGTLAGVFSLMDVTIHMSFDYDIPKIEIVRIF